MQVVLLEGIDGARKRIELAMASLRMDKPSRPRLSTVYDISTVLTDVAHVGSMVMVVSKLSSTSFDAQVAFDEMQQRAEAVNSVGSRICSFQLYVSKVRNIIRQQQKSHKGGECDTNVIMSIQQDFSSVLYFLPIEQLLFHVLGCSLETAMATSTSTEHQYRTATNTMALF